jgi:membrane-associated phospholipid phosphatase
VIFEEKFESNEMFIPTSSGDINLNFAYPITLSGTKCYPADLASCNDSSSSTCCKLAYDISIYPFQHLTGFQTLLLVIFVPIIYIVIRTLVWMLQSDRLTVRNVIPNGSPRTFPYIYWCLIIWENIIGLIITLLFEEIITISFKSMVGEPRPIFYSLKYWSEIHKTLRYDFFTNCYKSFPSGHSSSAAAGFGYIACIGFNDSLVFFRKMPLLSRISFMLAVCSVTFALWVGASRIIDYWHFQWDVLGKARFLILFIIK